jgi:hypothetical protein
MKAGMSLRVFHIWRRSERKSSAGCCQPLHMDVLEKPPCLSFTSSSAPDHSHVYPMGGSGGDGGG